MTKIIPVALILIGLFMWRYPTRSSFNRRNEYGVEVFKSYGHMRGRKSLEGLVRLGGAFLILAGIGQFIVPAKYSFSHIDQPETEASAPAQAPDAPPRHHHRH